MRFSKRQRLYFFPKCCFFVWNHRSCCTVGLLMGSCMSCRNKRRIFVNLQVLALNCFALVCLSLCFVFSDWSMRGNTEGATSALKCQIRKRRSFICVFVAILTNPRDRKLLKTKWLNWVRGLKINVCNIYLCLKSQQLEHSDMMNLSLC